MIDLIKYAEVTPLRPSNSWEVAPTEYVPATERPKERWSSIDHLEEVVRRAFANGVGVQIDRAWRPGDDGTEFRRHFQCRYHGSCQNPYVYATMATHQADATPGIGIRVEMMTRCRRCDECRNSKAMYWAHRAVDEFYANPSTYMVTLTLAPEMHYFFDAQMHSSAPELGPRLSAMEKAGETGLASATLFRARAQTIGAEVQRYLKRIRKRAPFRYLQVAEAHGSDSHPGVAGRPHFHILLHELELGTLITESEYKLEAGPCTRCSRWHKNAGELCDHAFVRVQWPHGHTKVVRCIDHKSAFYLCKYMSKAMEVRVRASIDYGDWTPGLAVTRAGGEIRDERSSPAGKLTPRVPVEPSIEERSETKVKRRAS